MWQVGVWKMCCLVWNQCPTECPTFDTAAMGGGQIYKWCWPRCLSREVKQVWFHSPSLNLTGKRLLQKIMKLTPVGFLQFSVVYLYLHSLPPLLQRRFYFFCLGAVPYAYVSEKPRINNEVFILINQQRCWLIYFPIRLFLNHNIST